MPLPSQFAAAFTIWLATAAALLPAAAQDYPTRAVTTVVPFPPGGGTDVLGRIIGKRLSETLGQQAEENSRPICKA